MSGSQQRVSVLKEDLTVVEEVLVKIIGVKICGLCSGCF